MRFSGFVMTIALAVATAGACRADDGAVRKELDAGYARMCQGVRHKSVKPMLELSTRDFTMEENGRTTDASTALAMLKQQFKTMQSISADTMMVRTLQVRNGQAIATVDYNIAFSMKDAKGKTHQVADKGVTEDIWVKTKSGWRIKKVKTLKSKPTLDGKPMKM